MKKTIIINLSPRQKGTSFVLSGICKDYLERAGQKADLYNLYDYIDKMERLYQGINHADTIIMCGPSYINCYPADTIALLQGMLTHREILHGQNLYGIIQGGMPYAHTHISGIRTLKLFCREAGLSFNGGFIMGLGAMLNGQPIDKLPNAKQVSKQLNIFFRHIEKGEESPDEVYEKSLYKAPKIMWRMMASHMNKKIDKDLISKGIDPYQKSPYRNA